MDEGNEQRNTLRLRAPFSCEVWRDGCRRRGWFWNSKPQMTGKRDIQRERILRGQCPTCGKEAAQYRLCYDCRQKGRIGRTLKRGESLGVFKSERRLDGQYWSIGPKADDPEVRKQSNRWSTPIVLPESDGRGKPRLRGVRVDVEATIIAVVERIGRPCTTEEILAAWGRLRDSRSSPLASDLAAIIAADDKRKRRALKLAAQHKRQTMKNEQR